jgi:predicted DNA binding CopG/RHH family protein
LESAPRLLVENERPDSIKKEDDFSKLKEVTNTYARKKKAVGINLSPKFIDYFKQMAEETAVPYQKLIDMHLLDCAKRRKKLTMKWVAGAALPESSYAVESGPAKSA